MPHRRRPRPAVEPTCPRTGRAPGQLFQAVGHWSQLSRSPRCHCLKLNQNHQFPHLTAFFCHFERLDLEILPQESLQSENFPHFYCFWKRHRCFGWTLPARWTDCYCGLTAGIAVLRWRAAVLRAASHSGPMTGLDGAGILGALLDEELDELGIGMLALDWLLWLMELWQAISTSPAGREQPV